MKIHPLTVEMFYVDGQSDRHDKANGHFFQFCDASKKVVTCS
jgi:hypothetical protein